MNCPCCSGKLLQHIDQRGLYWYCTACRQAMPVLSTDNPLSLSSMKQSRQSDRPSKSQQYWLYIPLKPEQQKTA